MKTTSEKHQKRSRRHARIRARVKGTATRPRLAVFRSNRFVYAQLIDDENRVTLLGMDSRTGKGKTATERAKETGERLAKEAKKKGIEKAVFDRGGFRYHGVVVALAEGARNEGLVL